MKADWKKKPLEQLNNKPLTKTEQLQAQLNAAIERNARQAQTLHMVEMQMGHYKTMLQETEVQARKNSAQALMYRHLAKIGVMVEENGEFKFLQGEKELAEFFERTSWYSYNEAFTNALTNSMMQTKQTVSKSIATTFTTDSTWQTLPKHW